MIKKIELSKYISCGYITIKEYASENLDKKIFIKINIQTVILEIKQNKNINN